MSDVSHEVVEPIRAPSSPVNPQNKADTPSFSARLGKSPLIVFSFPRVHTRCRLLRTSSAPSPPFHNFAFQKASGKCYLLDLVVEACRISMLGWWGDCGSTVSATIHRCSVKVYPLGEWWGRTVQYSSVKNQGKNEDPHKLTKEYNNKIPVQITGTLQVPNNNKIFAIGSKKKNLYLL